MFTVRAKYQKERVGYDGAPHAIWTRAKFNDEGDAFAAATLVVLAGAVLVDIWDDEGFLYDIVAWDGERVCNSMHEVLVRYETVGLGGCVRCDRYEDCQDGKGACC